jgi:hypothetical protein
MTWQAVQCVVCRLLVRTEECSHLRTAVPGPHYPVLDQRTMAAYPASDSEIFPTYCNGSYVAGPVVTVEMSSDHEIEDDGDPVVLWEQGQGD